MSQADVDLVRRALEAGVPRDGASALALYDPALVWDVSRLQGVDFGAGLIHGHDGFRHWLREWYTAWESTHNDVEELIDAGEYVVSIMTQRGRGRASGAQVELKQYAVWTIHDGKIARVVWFPTREEAFAAVGLSK
jgi:ketosteroid isomerase-like protein